MSKVDINSPVFSDESIDSLIRTCRDVTGSMAEDERFTSEELATLCSIAGAIGSFAEVIRQLRNRVKRSAAGEWVRCSERLPELVDCGAVSLSRAVLFVTSGGAIQIGNLLRHEWVEPEESPLTWEQAGRDGEAHAFGDVTHWAPLHAPDGDE